MRKNIKILAEVDELLVVQKYQYGVNIDRFTEEAIKEKIERDRMLRERAANFHPVMSQLEQ